MTKASVRAVCPGSFDPIQLGHLDIIARAARLFDEVIVAVGNNTTKNYLLDPAERVRLTTDALSGLEGVRVLPLTGLLTDFCAALGAEVIVKGIRFGSDFDYELQQSQLNRALSGIDTVLLPTSQQYGMVSSTMLREIAHNGGDISPFVTPLVNAAVLARLGR